MPKTIRLIAIGSMFATGAAIFALLPSANAAGETADEIMGMCNRSREIDGVKQQAPGGTFDGYLAETCDFTETKFETFDAPVQKASPDFPNCEPNATDPASVSVTWSGSAAQGQGKSTLTQQGGGGGLFGLLNLTWQRHEGTLDMTTETATVGDTETREVPPGKVLHMEFTPRMQRMTGIWKVHTPAREGNGVLPGSPEVNLETEEVVEGPVVLPSAAGAPGRLDGEIKPVFTDC